MKLKLGDTQGRLHRVNSSAWCMLKRCVNMRYAIQIVAEREIPAKQCTNTRPPSLLTESIGHNEEGRRSTQVYALSNKATRTRLVVRARAHLPMKAAASLKVDSRSSSYASSTEMRLYLNTSSK